MSGIGGSRANAKSIKGVNRQLHRGYMRELPGQFMSRWKPSKRAGARKPKRK